jgi:hypothetical protein
LVLNEYIWQQEFRECLISSTLIRVAFETGITSIIVFLASHKYVFSDIFSRISSQSNWDWQFRKCKYDVEIVNAGLFASSFIQRKHKGTSRADVGVFGELQLCCPSFKGFEFVLCVPIINVYILYIFLFPPDKPIRVTQWGLRCALLLEFLFVPTMREGVWCLRTPRNPFSCATDVY